MTPTYYRVVTEFTDGSTANVSGFSEMDVTALLAGTLANIPFDRITITPDTA